MAFSLRSKLLNNPFSVRSNIAVNVAANVAIAAIYFISVPLFVRYVGVEGYGLIGFFIFAQGLLSVFDLGLNLVLTREFAVESGVDPARSSRLRDLLRTAEILYWAAGAGVGLVWAASSGLLGRFVNAQALSEGALYQSFLLMGAVIALQFPVSLYSSALFGLQRQAAASLVGVLFSILRNLGVVVYLHYVSSSLPAFFGWQLLCWLLHVPVLAFLVRTSLPARLKRPHFKLSLISDQWKLVAQVGIVTLATMALMQVDKFVLARSVSLEAFGFYSLAAIVANGFQWVIQPVFKALLPRLSQLTHDEERPTLSLLYHQGCQILAVMVFPLAGLWIYFSYEMMAIWQRDPLIATNTYLIVSLLVFGAALNSVIYMPYALQIAFGRTRLQLIAVFASLSLSVPLTIFAVMRWGGIGAAGVGILLNLGIAAFVGTSLHRSILKGEAPRWILNDIALPAAGVLIAGAVCRYFFVEYSLLANILQLGAALIAMTAGAIALSSLARQWIAKRLRTQLAKF